MTNGTVDALLSVIHTNQTTVITDVDAVVITAEEESFTNQVRCTVSNQAISFHFTKSQTTFLATTLHWLTTSRDERGAQKHTSAE